MEKWTVFSKRADFSGIAERFGIDPVIARIIRNRDIVGDEAIEDYLYAGTEKLCDPYLLKGMNDAVRILKGKLADGAKIRIIGDYDIDGIMSSYILKTGLKRLGGSVDIKIPNRVTDGYGLNESLIRIAAEDQIDTIVTCDNGIAALTAVSLAKELGMTVIVTDHHEVLSVPDADAVVDPKQPGDTYPNKNICGAGVAWKLILALGGDPDLDLMQYAAIATVGDIVDLTGENRIIVREGLKRLRHTKNKGLIKLAEVNGIAPDAIDTYHIGFVIGPCLNASGRLDTAMRADALLEADSDRLAEAYASELKSLNDSRKSMTEKGVEAARAVIEDEHLEKDRVLVVFLPDAHESIAGIIAGRLREEYTRPVFVLTRGEEAVKGSGRSIEAYSMFEELVGTKDLLLKFGGHPMAAGLSLTEENIAAFRRRINELCTLTKEDLVEKIRIDVPMPISYVSENLIRQMELLKPFGKGNEKPVFAQKHVYFEHPRLFGAKQNLLKCRVRSMKRGGDADPDKLGFQAATEGLSVDAVAFRRARELYDRVRQSPDVSIVYEPQINHYMGRDSIQLVVRHFM
jgi:single-stranded-DNA-specific exonuclease